MRMVIESKLYGVYPYQEVDIMELKGSKTEQNLRTAFSGESEARNKYT